MALYRPVNIQNWYWVAQDGRVYSSARNQLVYSYDSGYLSFAAQNGAASPWPVDTNGKQTNAALKELLAFYGITANLPQ